MSTEVRPSNPESIARQYVRTIRRSGGPRDHKEQLLVDLGDEIERLTQMLREDAPDMQHHEEPCDYCGKPVNNLAGNPSEWCLSFPRPDGSGVGRAHHVGCVMERLVDRERLRAALEQIRDVKVSLNASGTPMSACAHGVCVEIAIAALREAAPPAETKAEQR